jgi:hypothetical protein
MVSEKQGTFDSCSIPSTGELLVKAQSAALDPIDHNVVFFFLKHYPAVQA